MAQAKSGDTIKVHYTGKLKDGAVFDSSRDREPLEFTLGGGQLIPGFENGVIGMAVGDTKTITIPPEEAYGPRHEGWPRTVKEDQLPKGFKPEVGSFLQVQQSENEVIRVMISNISDEGVVLDNHPLAGKELLFDVELVAIG
jgi:peptidylprolyl isomerase